MKKTKKEAPIVEATTEVKIEKRGRHISAESGRQIRLRRFQEMRDAGIEVKRGRPKKKA